MVLEYNSDAPNKNESVKKDVLKAIRNLTALAKDRGWME